MPAARGGPDEEQAPSGRDRKERPTRAGRSRLGRTRHTLGDDGLDVLRRFGFGGEGVEYAANGGPRAAARAGRSPAAACPNPQLISRSGSRGCAYGRNG
jgi:hypothetical protein